MINKKDVQHIAQLARLGLTSAEVDKFRKELSSILDYVEKLKKIDVSKIEPTSHPRLVENVMRGDGVRSSKFEVRRKLVKMAPETKKGYIKVKSVL